MTARDAAALMFVGLGVLAGLAALTFVQTSVLSVIFMSDGNGTSVFFRALTLLPSAVLAWVAVGLVRDRGRHAARLFPESNSAGPAADRTDLQLIGVTLIGLFVFVRAMPGFAQWLIELGGAIGAGTGPFGGGNESKLPWVSGFAYAIVDVAAGAVLVKKRHAVRRFLFDRTEEVDPTEDPAVEASTVE